MATPTLILVGKGSGGRGDEGRRDGNNCCTDDGDEMKSVKKKEKIQPRTQTKRKAER